MGKKRKRSNFIIQGSILAIASIIVRIIGLIYRIPLTNIIGDEGMGYYSYAYEPYAVMLLLSYHGLPTAVSKLVAEKNGEGRYRNSYRVFKMGMLLAVVIGAITGAVLWFGADFIAGTLNKQPMSSYALKVLGPTLFILSIMGIFRGYFQGTGTMIPTAISQILEAVANAIVSVVAAKFLYDAGKKFDLVTGSVSRAEAYGAAGGTMGTCVGALAALLFLAFVYSIYKGIIKKQIRRDRVKEVESYAGIARMLFFISAPIVLSSVIMNIGTSVDAAVFSSIMQGHFKIPEAQVAANWGIFTNKYKILIMVPVAISTALATSIVPDFSEEMAAGNKGRVINKVSYAIRFSMIIAIPCAVGLSVLASPVLKLLFDNVQATDINLLRFGSVAAVVYSLSTVSNAILQGINQINKPVLHAGVGLVLHIVLLAVSVRFFHADIYGVMAAYVAFALIICILNAIEIKRVLNYRQEIVKTFLLPAACSLIMGIAVFGIYFGLQKVMKQLFIPVVLSILLGALVYGVLMLLLKGINENDLYSLPKGENLVRLFRKFHLL